MVLKKMTPMLNKDQFHKFGEDAKVIMKKYENDFYIFYLKYEILVPILKSEPNDLVCKELFDSEPILNIMYTGSEYGTGNIVLQNDSANGPEIIYTFE